MDLISAVRSRTSTARVLDEAPSDEELERLLAIAAHAPDHAALRPWRLVSLRGDDRRLLGAALVAGFGDAPGTPEAAKTAAKPLRSPLLLSIVAVLDPSHPKVPVWEQIAATAALVTTLELVLYAEGWTAMWRTGPAVELAEVRELIGVDEGRNEKLLGWLYIGRTDPADQTGVRRDPDVAGRLSSGVALRSEAGASHDLRP